MAISSAEAQSVTIEVDWQLVDVYYSNGSYFSGSSANDYCIPYGSIVKLIITPNYGYEFTNGLISTSFGTVIDSADADGNLEDIFYTKLNLYIIVYWFLYQRILINGFANIKY